jgi:signal transduction histidine kinase
VRRGGVSLRSKLIAFIAIPLLAIIVVFSWYFTSRQWRDFSKMEDLDATVYGQQYVLEVRTAVAFGDRATASEVLDPVILDTDVAAVTLFGANGTTLYRAGKPSPWVGQAQDGTFVERLVHTHERTVSIVPVVSMEGPRGTLVIEISTARRRAMVRESLKTTTLFALAALAFGVFAAWVIVRSLARRLRAIGDVATAAATDLAVAVVDTGNDEISIFADAFNEMLGQLRADRARLTETVKDLRAAEDGLAIANRELEQRVVDRTAQLEAEMQRRADVEVELRQAQKLESVGRLAAGIAHEINSPVQFVSHSCTFLDEANQAMIELVATRRELVGLAASGAITMAEMVERMRAADEHQDVDDLIESIPAASKLVQEGLERVTGIVRAMKEFAYADQRAQTPSDLNRAIENTLLVTCNEYKYVADTKVSLGGLPPVVCHVGEFNQAILNIIVNAAHSIEDKNHGTSNRGCITVRTWVDRGDAAISISDDGCGIPADILDKIFDPFFTTKQIGRGSGQGLAIARSVIVDKHGGRLDVTSKVGVGTTFTIRLPIAGMATAIAA